MEAVVHSTGAPYAVTGHQEPAAPLMVIVAILPHIVGLDARADLVPLVEVHLLQLLLL